MSDKLFDKLDLGEHAKIFVESEMGRYFIARLHAYNDDLLEKFVAVVANDESAVLELKAMAKVPELIAEWIATAIEAGAEAEYQLKENEENS